MTRHVLIPPKTFNSSKTFFLCFIYFHLTRFYGNWDQNPKKKILRGFLLLKRESTSTTLHPPTLTKKWFLPNALDFVFCWSKRIKSLPILSKQVAILKIVNYSTIINQLVIFNFVIEIIFESWFFLRSWQWNSMQK